MKGIWDCIKEELRKELPQKAFCLWLDPLTPIEEDEHRIVLGCPNKFSKNWIKENYGRLFEETLRKIGFDSYEIHFKLTPSRGRKQNGRNGAKQLLLPTFQPYSRIMGRILNRDFTFERFVVGRCNEFAYQLARSLSECNSAPYNSIIFISGTGLGKSHLSQAIGHEIIKKFKDIKVCYITAEDFVNEMVYSIKNGNIDDFKNKYRTDCDVLLLEEVHFLGGKPAIQIELGHTLDTLIDSGKKVIFTSSIFPKDIPKLNKDLLSRLSSGVISQIHRPDYDTRVEIISRKAMEKGIRLSDEIIQILAENLTKDIRQIESAINSIKAKSELLNVKITPELAHEEISCRVSKRKNPTLEDIKNLICEYFKIEPRMLKGRSRKKIHCYPRKVYVYLCRKFTNETLENIGKSINRNHSTVLYASEIIEKQKERDPSVKRQLEFLSQRLEEMLR